MSKPFEGLKVLDLTTFVAAPCVCRLLADLGAEVIKVEKPTGDGWRQTSLTYCSGRFTLDENPVYDYYNAGKKHIVLDLKTDEGKELFDKLMAQSDIFVTNTRLGGLQRLGFSYDDIKEKYPRLIYAMIEGYGEKGEDAATAAYDTTAFWARCGMLRDLAVVDDETGAYNPIYPPSSVGDTVTAFLTLSQINAALYSREKTGKGQLVKSGLFHTGIFTFGTMQVANQRKVQKMAYPRKRYYHSQLAGYYKCSDGEYLYVATGVVQQTFERLCRAIGREDCITDERYSTMKGRYEHAKEFIDLVNAEFIKKPRAEWIKICKSVDLAVTPVNGFADVSEDPQAIANGYVEDVTFRSGETLKMAACPIHMSSMEGEDMSTHPAPLTGANTDEVLKDIGLTDDQIKALHAKGIIDAR